MSRPMFEFLSLVVIIMLATILYITAPAVMIPETMPTPEQASRAEPTPEQIANCQQAHPNHKTTCTYPSEQAKPKASYIDGEDFYIHHTGTIGSTAEGAEPPLKAPETPYRKPIKLHQP